jgi:hypothetical protein
MFINELAAAEVYLPDCNEVLLITIRRDIVVSRMFLPTVRASRREDRAAHRRDMRIGSYEYEGCQLCYTCTYLIRMECRTPFSGHHD